MDAGERWAGGEEHLAAEAVGGPEVSTTTRAPTAPPIMRNPRPAKRKIAVGEKK
ncbi:hypothetical protein [Streptosporangium sp. 'caverna']|uniref:hypothetical protein n=1 Tax=Streptosporangium sp. 'caverna' TaxID=2202249 RepID=UPI0013A6A6CB|nr:hypothetical protein [Streptosporangium sp. 'caverna']